MSLSKASLLVPVLLALWSGEARSERSDRLSSPEPVAIAATPGSAPAPVGHGAGPSAFEPFHLSAGGAHGAYEARLSVLSGEIAADRTMLALCRSGFRGCSEAGRRFLAMLEAARDKTGRAKLGAINRSINLTVTYTSDEVQHGQPDVWSSPLATFDSLRLRHRQIRRSAGIGRRRRGSAAGGGSRRTRGTGPRRAGRSPGGALAGSRQPHLPAHRRRRSRPLRRARGLQPLARLVPERRLRHPTPT